jgi:hypothetical protein
VRSTDDAPSGLTFVEMPPATLASIPYASRTAGPFPPSLDVDAILAAGRGQLAADELRQAVEYLNGEIRNRLVGLALFFVRLLREGRSRQ